MDRLHYILTVRFITCSDNRWFRTKSFVTKVAYMLQCCAYCLSFKFKILFDLLSFKKNRNHSHLNDRHFVLSVTSLLYFQFTYQFEIIQEIPTRMKDNFCHIHWWHLGKSLSVYLVYILSFSVHLLVSFFIFFLFDR